MGRRILLGFAIAAVAGFSIFGLMVARVVDVDRVTDGDVDARFLAVRDSLGLGPPILVRQGDRFVRRPVLEGAPALRPHTLHVLAFRQHRLVSATVPFWFLRLKAPAVRFVLRDTGVDLDRMGVTPGQLARYGPSIVIDEQDTAGDRLLVWTE